MGLLNNDKVLVTYRGDCFGQEILLTRGFRVFGDFPAITSVATDLLGIVDDIIAGVLDTTAAKYLACLAPQYSMRTVRAQKINASRSAYKEAGNVAAGTHASAATVANDSACLTLRGDFAGRHFISNKHIGPVPDAASAAGLLTAPYTAIVATLGVAMLVSWVPTGSGSLLIPSVWAGPAADALTLTAQRVGAQSRTQRRRTVGLGS